MEFLEISFISLIAIALVVIFIVFRNKLIQSRRGDSANKVSFKDQKQELASEEQAKYESLIFKEANLKEKEEQIGILEKQLLQQQKSYNTLIEQCKQEQNRLKTLLLDYLGMSKKSLKNELYQLIEEELIEEKGRLIRRYEHEAKNDARKRANYIIAQATTRIASEFAQERLVNVVNLPDDKLKGRIIGKDGRNIKIFEMITGVDLIIDETPASIVLSSFNLYRRTIATKVMEELIADGRIQPSRIEEVYARVSAEMEDQLLQDGNEVVLNLRLGEMHADLKQMIGRLKYRASFGQNALSHSIEVAELAGIIAGELGGDVRLAKRAGVLHDIGKSLTQDVAGSHVDLGYDVCLKYQEDPIVLDAIRAHHGDEEARSIEAAAVCCADALSAARPGARREALENFLKRSIDLEAMAMRKMGVKQAYAINSGKEIRVIVDSTKVDDCGCIVLAREVAKEIEETLQYPGEIKVHVIRESRAMQIAH